MRRMKEEKTDLKKTALLFRKKIMNVIVTVLAGAVLFAGIYLLQRGIFHNEKLYRSSSDYYITFNLEEYPNGVDHYNAYTWDSILRDDPIIDAAMEYLPDDFTEEELKQAVSGEMLGDYRILTVHVTAKDADRVEQMAEAMNESITRFPGKIDMLKTVEQWSTEPCRLLTEKNRVWNAAALGALAGLAVGLFAFAFAVVLDDGVYVEKDYRFAGEIPFLGMMTKGNSTYGMQEIQSNMKQFLEEGKKYPLVEIHGNRKIPEETVQKLTENTAGAGTVLSMSDKDLQELKKADGLILMAEWGNGGMRMMEKTVSFLKKQECRPAGIIFYGADNRFLKKYYGIR